jgi:hypothetical protein
MSFGLSIEFGAMHSVPRCVCPDNKDAVRNPMKKPAVADFNAVFITQPPLEHSVDENGGSVLKRMPGHYLSAPPVDNRLSLCNYS